MVMVKIETIEQRQATNGNRYLVVNKNYFCWKPSLFDDIKVGDTVALDVAESGRGNIQINGLKPAEELSLCGDNDVLEQQEQQPKTPQASKKELGFHDLGAGIKVPFMTAEDIQVRVLSANEGKKSAQLVLYTDLFYCTETLNRLFGLNWSKRITSSNNGAWCCEIGVKSPDGTWIYRGDVGGGEDDRGNATTAFKRACASWGIGLELYSSPNLFFPKDKTKLEVSNGREYIKDSFTVDDIEYYNGKIRSITIKSKETGNCFTYS